jgi:hypothetical protein
MVSKLSDYLGTGTQIVTLATPTVAVVGFVIFLRYCLEISYFPELSLSAFAGFFAAIFFLSLLIVTVFLLLWWGSSMPVKAILLQWEDYKNQGRRLVENIYIWIIASLIFPSLILFMVFGRNPQGYKGDAQMPIYGTLAFTLLMGMSVPFFASRLRFTKPYRIKSLPRKVTIELCVYWGTWSFFGFFMVMLAYSMWGMIGMFAALYGAVVLLLLSMGAVAPDKRDTICRFWRK